jgi:hypothetical protein
MPTADFIKKKKENGICIDCEQDAFPGYIQCREHRKISYQREVRYEARSRKKRKIAARKDRIKRINECRCSRCGKDLKPDADGKHRTCLNCREQQHTRIAYEALPHIYAL